MYDTHVHLVMTGTQNRTLKSNKRKSLYKQTIAVQISKYIHDKQNLGYSFSTTFFVNYNNACYIE